MRKFRCHSIGEPLNHFTPLGYSTADGVFILTLAE
jgi:hypothetical protein